MFEPEIIYEDKDVLAIDKPDGMDVVAIGEWLGERCPGARVAHRLDKDTTGVLLIAKSEKIYEDFLKPLFQNHGIQKTYLALVYGSPRFAEASRGDWHTINLPIGRSRKDPRKRIAGKGATGVLREALTEYRVLEHFDKYTLVEAKPKTGRTHQIRVHFKALGYPLVADELYAPESMLAQSGDLPIKRQALHAASLELVLPSGKPIKLEAPLREDFSRTLASLRAS